MSKRFIEPVASVKERLNYAMSIRGINQAELIVKTGISSASLSQYTNGKYTPKQNRIVLLAKALSVSESWLMGFDVPMERNDNEEFIKDTFDYSLIGADEKYLIELYTHLSPSHQDALLTLAEKLSK